MAQTTDSSTVIPASTGVENSGYWSEPLDLLDEELSVNWKHFSSVKTTSLNDVWVHQKGSDEQEAMLVCLGDPKGFLYTEHEYSEFDLRFEWQIVSDPNGNSGVLVFTQEDMRLWPSAIQVQLHQPEAGNVFPSGDAFAENTVKRESLARPVGEWNECHIESHDGRILVHINGSKAGEVTGCKPNQGRIAIQSEGSEFRFRRIHLREPRTKSVSDIDSPRRKADMPDPQSSRSSAAG